MLACSIQSRRHHGFTLIELLVVISIISVLVALSAAGLFQVINAQRHSRTEDGVRQISKVLLAQWQKVVDDANKEEPSPAVQSLAETPQRARVIWRKFRLAEAFPQSYAEIKTATMSGGGVYGNGPGGPWIEPANRKYMKNYFDAIKNATGTQPTAESGACLYLALRVNRGGSSLNEETLPSFVGDSDNDGVKEFIDSWGRPLRFQRFPIGNAELAAMKPNDLLDPDRQLQQGGWHNRAGGQMFANLLNHPFAQGNNPQPYFLPIVVSDGRDELPGTADDIISFRVSRVDR